MKTLHQTFRSSTRCSPLRPITDSLKTCPALIGLTLMLSAAAVAEEFADGLPEPGAQGQYGDYSSAGDLAKAAQNPVADLISLPFQNNTNFNFGPQ